jgi:hypothetical protein
MLIVTAFTFNGASNITDSTYATSALVLGCQHRASSKFAPSLLVKIFTSPGLYAQSIFNPKAVRREFKTPVHVTVCALPCPPAEHLHEKRNAFISLELALGTKRATEPIS